MNHSKLKKVLAGLLSLVMFISAIPMTASASSTSLTIASSTKTALAPGVTETSVVSYDSNGDRVQYFVVNANIATENTVQVKANYHDNDNTGVWGKATVIEQANAAKEKRGYNVVATTNGAYYNVSTGQPTGGFVMEGVNINGDAMGNATEFFAIMKDGTAMIGKRGTFSQYSADIQEAVGGYKLLVWDGTVVEGLNNTSKYPRCTVGVKENGDVVLMLADGNNKPYSAGLTYAEQAQIMVEQGCVAAVELDGGGSATYAAKLEGSDEMKLRSVPCDGTIRSVSNSIMVISTAVADGTFDHANLSTEYAFYAPNSKVEIDAVGADAAGGAAEIPADVTWALSDSSFGTIADGVFTSNGKLGTVTAQMISGDKVVGSIDITLVNPTDIAFSASEKTVPYGKTSDFTITSMYNGAEMYVAADAFDFELSAGSMDGFIFSSPTDETITNATVKATYKYAEMEAITVNVVFGKGSEILVDFESGDISEWVEINGLKEAAENGIYTGGFTDASNTSAASNHIAVGLTENVFLASRENGDPVYNGDYALGYTLDYTQSTSHANWQYAYLYYLGDLMTYRDVDKGINGTRLGMWMYIPEEAVGLCARLAYTYEKSDGTLNTAYLYFTYQYVAKGFSKLTSEKIPEAGWAYVYCDLDDISTSYVTSSYYKDENGNATRDSYTNYAPAFIQFIVSSSATGAEKCTVYIDDITLDYSDVVDDRDAPVISNPLALDDLNSYALDGRTLNFNSVSFTADVAEDTTHGTNYTGLDESTAQIYVDGHKVATSISAGKISTGGVVLPNGTHDVTFEIADKQGNYTKLTKQIVIEAETEYPVITVEGEAPTVNADGNLYTGSQYNLLVNTDKVEAVDEVTTKIWLNSASKWALEHMTVLPGFEASYTLDELSCTAEITVKRVGEVDATGEATLVTIPVYAWAWDGSAGHDSTTQWNTEGCAPQTTVSYKVKYGSVVYTDACVVEDANYVAGFGNVRQDVATELNSSIANLKNTIGIWHSHTAEAVDDVAATCENDGYSGRTACTVCKSVVDWGTVQEATGHTYTFVDTVLKCNCGELFTGTHTDGKEYVEGVVVTDGWNGDYYYVDGVKLTGVQLVDGYYYNFGEDGISQGKYTGLFVKDGLTYYTVLGELKSGWNLVDDAWYYFDTTTFAGYHGSYKDKYCGLDNYNFTYVFENGKLTDGVWVKLSKGTFYFYGPSKYIDCWKEIDGNTYCFDESGYIYTGIAGIKSDPWSPRAWYVFDDNGVYQGEYEYTGIYFYEGKYWYIVDGISNYAGLVEVNGDFYYINGSTTAVTGSYSCSKTNGIVPAGTYQFGEDGKMLNGVVEQNGELRYYSMGKLSNGGLVEYNGSYYYFKGDARVATGSYSCTKTNGIIPEGTYLFESDGKLANGIITKDDGLMYYYVMGKPNYVGMFIQDGSYYYARGNGQIVTGLYYCSKNNGLLPENTNYNFDENGRMLNGLIQKDDGVYYYVNGKPCYAGLFEYDGAYYYARGNGKLVTGSYTCSKTNGIVPEDTYTFGEDGKMLDGLVQKDDGTYYYVMGKSCYAGLFEYDGAYYYARGNGKLVTGSYTCSKTNGIVPEGTYTFGEDGKMLDGLIQKEDGIYYYVMGKTCNAGLFEFDGEYYYAKGNGKLATGSYTCSKTNGIVSEGTYTFGEDGKMLNGLVQKENGLYYYYMGKINYAGLILIDGDYYYIKGSGMATTGSYYCSKTNDLLPAATYKFGDDGKMIK